MRPWLTLPCDWRRPKIRRAYNLFWCGGCRYGTLHPRPDPDELLAAYEVDDYYTHGDEPRGRCATQNMAQQICRSIAWRFDRGLRQLGDLVRSRVDPSATVLDIGCGNGQLMRDLHRHGFQPVGVEVDPLARKAAQSGSLEVHAGTAECLPQAIAGQRFDVIVMSHVLEHCIDPGQALANVVERLQPQGLFFVFAPNNTAVEARRHGAAWPMLDVPRHLNFYSARSLTGHLKMCGIRVEDIVYSQYERQFSPLRQSETRAIVQAFKRIDGNGPGTRTTTGGTIVHLALTALARPEAKYDSLCAIARVDT